jgi:hypothetical protein
MFFLDLFSLSSLALDLISGPGSPVFDSTFVDRELLKVDPLI